MARPYDEDLFEDTKMTFGEHLEELRSSLMKALAALVIGALFGLLVGNYVVRWMQVPLKESLESYYQKQAVDRLVELIKVQQERGEPLPESLKGLAEMPTDEAREAIEAVMGEQQLLPEQVYVDGKQVVQELRKSGYDVEFQDPAPNAEEGLTGLDRGKMIRLFLWRPMEDDLRTKVKSLNPQEAFFIYIKAALLFGAVVASPFIFYYIWMFVGAGLYPHEKRYVHLFLPISIVLFLAGAALAFFVVFAYVLDFLFTFNSWLGIDPDPRISEWLSFALMLPLGFGVAFQLPLAMLFLERVGIFSIEVYLDKWRIAVLVISILSMLLTPADPMSMLLMFVPMTVLYFSGIALCRFLPRSRSPFDEPIE